LSEISEKRIVFARGAAKVEVPLDYFRKIDAAERRPAAAQTTPAGQAAAPGAVAPPRVVTPPAQPNVPTQRMPRVTPALPRRDREPAAGE